MRGRLICPLLAEIARIDTDAIAAASGYDPDFRTVRTTYPSGERVKARVEMPTVKIPAQVEMGAWEAQTQTRAGNAPDSRLTLVFHFRDLERLHLVGSDGSPLLRVNDRLIAIWERMTGLRSDLVRPEAGGLYATQVAPAGAGLGGRRNLLAVTFDERVQGFAASP